MQLSLFLCQRLSFQEYFLVKCIPSIFNIFNRINVNEEQIMITYPFGDKYLVFFVLYAEIFAPDLRNQTVILSNTF